MSRPSPLVALVLLALVWLGCLAAIPFFGAQSIGPSELIGGDSTSSVVFWRLRLPRVLLLHFH